MNLYEQKDYVIVSFFYGKGKKIYIHLPLLIFFRNFAPKYSYLRKH